MKKNLIKIAAIGACLSLAGTASALQTVESLNVVASIEAVCTASATPLNFGAYSQMTGNHATSILTLDCSPGTAFTVSLDAGQNFMGWERRLSDVTTGAALDYLISGPMGPWGDDGLTYPAPSYMDMAMGGPQDFFIEGDIPPGQPGPAGSYTDVVTITVSY